MQEFLSSIQGQLLAVAVIVALLVLIFKTTKKEKRNHVKAMTYSAIGIAIAFILNTFVVFKMPQAGSATLFSMLVIVLIGYWFGPSTGIMAGVAFGILNMLYAPFVVHPIQFLLDYPLAFGMLGISGFFGKMKNGLQWGYLAAVFGRYLCHVLSGIIFFAEYAGETNAVLYSLAYNATYLAIEATITFALLWVPVIRGAFQRIKTSIA